jgi:hypothetical protein
MKSGSHCKFVFVPRSAHWRQLKLREERNIGRIGKGEILLKLRQERHVAPDGLLKILWFWFLPTNMTLLRS